MIAGLIGALILFFVTMPMARRQHWSLARKRRHLDAAGFERAMARVGVTSTTARFLWRDLGAFYHAPLKPSPSDRLESLIWIDRPEVEGIVLRFWAAMRGQDAIPAATLPPDPSVADLGRHLDLMAGWSLKGSA
ncbi:MAG: hypothetical protein H0W65_07355 [Sphingomonas sp.]|uniref:hypothetical protein n=1 Tax=Sphingomonas sp. TaxID=28214 RepID=UPI0017B63E0D|nr:hypothetical protein [Sphingomonas sp.]MBA3667522.1 hypothetical protein [Sphingomonas sp.]